jgi:RimJ/RimL family protein N-acetyltransferase
MPGQQADRYWMRPMGLDDVPLIAGWFEHLEDLAMFDRQLPMPLNSEAMKAGWRETLAETEPRSNYWFTIDDRAGEVVGIAGLQDINYVHGDGVLPIYLAEPVRRKGIGLRVGAMLLDLAFDQLRLNRVTSFYRADNVATSRLVQAIGFSEEGRMRKAWFADGKHLDIVVIGILASEWLARRDNLASSMSRDTVVILGRAAWGARAWPQVSADELKAASRISAAGGI